MVQALAFAEIFLGLILADAGYKGVSVAQVVKGAAGAEVAPAALGAESTGAQSGSASGSTVPSHGGAIGDVTPESEAQAIAKGELLAPPPASLGPSKLNIPPISPEEAATTACEEAEVGARYRRAREKYGPK